MHFLLFYEVAEDYLERRVQFRAEHHRRLRSLSAVTLMSPMAWLRIGGCASGKPLLALRLQIHFDLRNKVTRNCTAGV